MSKIKEKAEKASIKEHFRDKRGKLKSALIQKLQLNQALVPFEKNVIVNAVEEYLVENPGLVQDFDIRNLQGIIDILLKKLTRDNLESKTLDINKVTNHKEHEETLDFNNEDKEKKKSALKDTSPSIHDDNTNPWTLIQAYNVIQAESIVAKEKSDAIQKRKDMASALQEQIRIKEELLKKEKDEDEKFVRIQNQNFLLWKKEQEKVAENDKQKVLTLRNVRQQQIQESLRKKKEENLEIKSRQLKEIENIKRSLNKEEELKRIKKEEERKKWELIKEENAKKLIELKHQKDEEARMDAELMEEMKRRYDLEEMKRAKELEERLVKAEKNGVMLKQIGAFSQKEQMIEFEKKLLKEVEERESAKVAEEKRKQDAMKEKKQNITESNRQMLEEKRLREKEREKEEIAYSEQCLKEKEALLAEKEAMRVKQYENKQRYRKVLHDQMREQLLHQLETDCMTSAERSINKKLMAKIESPEVKEKIFEKLSNGNQQQVTHSEE